VFDGRRLDQCNRLGGLFDDVHRLLTSGKRLPFPQGLRVAR
jgi:hypothetical protein